MAIDITNPDHASRLSRALRKSFTEAALSRKTRRNLLDIYQDKGNPAFERTATDEQDLGTLLNLFQKFVRGHLLTLAFYAPKWGVDATTVEGRGLDKRVEDLLTRYAEILNFQSIQEQLALDSAFGWAVAKVDNGIAPKGITAPVAPRLYRLNPDMFIVDPTAATVDEASYVGDIYLAPLNEAQVHPGFIPEQAAKLSEYRNSSGESHNGGSYNANSSFEAYAEPMVRLIDVYIPKTGIIYTWPAPNDEFHAISSEPPLGKRQSKINPYTLLSLMKIPGYLAEISRLRSLRGLHLVSNEMLTKGIQQARSSQRNPVAPLGSEQDMTTALEAGDNNPIFLEDPEKLKMYTIPGPDNAVLNLGTTMAQMFSQEAGNLEVALGASAGADTARQTEALLGQISASQSLDRKAFELFLSQIGEKIATLAFLSEDLDVETIRRVPGTQIEVSQLWTNPALMPRAADITSLKFAVVPFSTAFRTPEERIAQLNQASQMVLQWLMAKVQGAPIDVSAVINSVGKSFDLLPELTEWWNGQDPTPAERASNTYQSMAQPAQGSDVRYQGSPQQQQDSASQQQQPAGGLS